MYKEKRMRPKINLCGTLLEMGSGLFMSIIWCHQRKDGSESASNYRNVIDVYREKGEA